jgi:cell division ATPase FtsA
MFKAQKDRSKNILIFDIGSASVAGAVVKYLPGYKPEIIYSTRIPYKFHQQISSDKLTKAMLESLELAVSKIESDGLFRLETGNFRIEKIKCFLSSPWSISQSKTVQIKKLQPFSISQNFLDNLLSQSIDTGKDNELGQGDELLDKKYLHFKVNGYEIDDPLEHLTKDIEATFFVSLASRDITQAIRKLLSKRFLVNDISLHSFTFPIFQNLKKQFKNENDFIFMDINGETTDVSLVKDGVLMETQSFPLGHNFLLRRIISDFDLSYEGALSALSLYLKKDHNVQTNNKMSEAFKIVKTSWLIFLKEIFGDFTKQSLLPKNIFIIADKNIAPVFQVFLKGNELDNFTLVNQPFNPVCLEHFHLKDCQFNETCNDKDIFLEISLASVSY